MSNPPLKRIEDLFHRALEMNPEERQVFLQTECAGDPDLKAAVEALLKHDQEEENATHLLVSPIQRYPAIGTKDASPGSSDAAVTFRPEGGELLLLPGELPQGIPGYEVLEELGRGGMGIVYKARQTGLNRLVALKMLAAIAPITGEELARFRIEVESLARLRHPNIVQIYEIGEHDGLPYFVMEYIDGPDLAQQTGGMPQPPLIAAHVVETLARAIAAVHQYGIIHRDLKPANVLLAGGTKSDQEGRQADTVTPTLHSPLTTQQPKITDFGLAKRIQGPGAGTLVGSVIGTPCYMPPEQVRGEIGRLGPWTDLYALGAILYELLTGRPPIQEASPAATLTKVLTDDPLPPSHWRAGLSRDLDTICLKCLEKDPPRRYASANDLAEDLRRYQAGEPVKARPIGMVERLWRWAKRQPLAAAALAATAILAITLIGTVLVYDARLRRALVKEEQVAEDRRLHLVQLDINIGIRELNAGDAFTALLWLAEAMKMDETNEDHRRRILDVLEHVPWLIKVGMCDGDVLASQFTSKGCCLAAARPDNCVQIWDVNTGQYVGPRLEHATAVVVAAFSPDGQFLATGSTDGALRLWRLDDGQADLIAEPAKSPLSPDSKFERLMFYRSGTVLVAQSVNDTVRRWLINNGKHISPERPVGAKGSNILSPDGGFAFSLDPSGVEFLYSMSEDKFTTAQIEIGHSGVPKALSADGRFVALVDNNKTVRIVETSTGRFHGMSLAHPHPIQWAMFTPQGDHILTVDAEHFARLWPWETGDQPVLTIPNGNLEGIVPFAQFSVNGRFLAALGSDDRLRVWHVPTQKQATPPLHSQVPLHYEAFSADGSRLIAVGKDHTVRLWDLSPCANRAARSANGHAIQPGITRDFTLPRLFALLEALAGASIDQDEQLTPLKAQDLLAAWRRFENAASPDSTLSNP